MSSTGSPSSPCGLVAIKDTGGPLCFLKLIPKKLYAVIVWIPKYRRMVLFQQSRPEVGALVRALFERKGCEVVEGSVCPDHIHACVRIPPKLAASDVMGYVKGKSAMVLRDRHPEWGRVVGRDKAFWARGYYVSTVGLNEETIRRYVAEQEDGGRFE